MKIRTLTFGRKKTQDYQSKTAEVTVELTDGDTYGDALRTAKTLVEVALGEVPSAEHVERARATLAAAERAELAVNAFDPSMPVPASSPAPKRRGRPPKSAQQPAGK